MYFVKAPEEHACSRNQHRSMGVMSTCMHDTGILRTERLTRHFIDRQCINIRSEANCPARVLPFYDPEYACTGKPVFIRNPQLVQLPAYTPGGFMFHGAEFRISVQFSSEINRIINNFFGNIHLLSP